MLSKVHRNIVTVAINGERIMMIDDDAPRLLRSLALHVAPLTPCDFRVEFLPILVRCMFRADCDVAVGL